MQVLPDTATKQYVKAIKLLEENNIQLDVLNTRIPITIQDFQILSYSSSDAKSLHKYFEAEVVDGYSQPLGFFPDAVTMAIEQRCYG